MTEYFTSAGEPATALAKNSKGKFITNGTCTRCGGSGKFSWCAMYGDICFGCKGTGKQVVRAYTKKEYDALVRNRERARERREARLAEETERRQAAEREKNGGLTNWELEEQKIKFREGQKERIREVLYEISCDMQDGNGRFRDSIARSMAGGDVPRGRGWDLVCEILAKECGRKTSTAYKAEYARIEKILKQAAEIEAGMAAA